ncbi:MAG: hypothetical protein WD645_05825 [Dehalococcoidia bacterium]
MYHIVDLGTKKGGALDVFRKRHGLYYPQQSIPPASCLGVDLQKKYARQVRSKGYGFRAADVLDPSFVWPESNYYLAWDFLEHLPDKAAADSVVRRMIRHAAKGIWLRMPVFEPEQEDRLRAHGLRFAWSHWSAHPCHYLAADAQRVIAEELTGRHHWQKVKTNQLIRTSKHRSVVPVEAPIDTVTYHPSAGPRPSVIFRLPVIGQWEVVVGFAKEEGKD